MSFTLTNAAARQVRQILASKGEHFALYIRIRRTLMGLDWGMRIEPRSEQCMLVGGVPILADTQSLRYLDGLIIDWVETPDGPGFGVYDQSLTQRDLKLGAD